MLQPLLIEIGVEELPAVPLLKELESIETKWFKILEENSLVGEFEFFYTPRRLLFWHREFLEAQPDTTEEMFGAPVSIAFKDDKPTRAAQSFAQKCGVAVDDLGRTLKNGKEILYFKKEIKGSKIETIMESMLLKLLKSLNFGKSMRWGSNIETFIRPIRWVNVMFGSKVVNVELFGMKSEAITYGHRSAREDAISIKNEKRYFEELKNSGVILFPDKRRDIILNKFKDIENRDGVKIDIDEELLDEVVAITEYPTPLIGNFDNSFLALPPEVIITSMKEHQRYFPVFKNGILTNKFVVVSNAYTEDYSNVISGNERVLKPRLADALFFYRNDLKRGLINDGLEKIVFMKGLGSMQDKVEREEKIANLLFAMNKNSFGFSAEDASILREASSLSKADLMSEMVYEFTELQGLMGYYYALALGKRTEVATLIKEQYFPTREESNVPSTPLSAMLAISYKVDLLFALFSVGSIPTGSRDPFGLRRAVNGLIKISSVHQIPFSLKEIYSECKGLYSEFEYSKLESFFLERLYSFYSVNDSIINAVLGSGDRELLRIDKKIKAVDSIVKSSDFKSIFSTFKRVANITKNIDLNSELSVDENLFDSAEEITLYRLFSVIEKHSYDSYEGKLEALFGLKDELDAFFNNVMVNVENIAIRENRKHLIARIYGAFKDIADIKEISV